MRDKLETAGIEPVTSRILASFTKILFINLPTAGAAAIFVPQRVLHH